VSSLNQGLELTGRQRFALRAVASFCAIVSADIPLERLSRCSLDEAIARQREARGPAADVHAVTRETTASEPLPDVAETATRESSQRFIAMLTLVFLLCRHQAGRRHQFKGGRSFVGCGEFATPMIVRNLR
jgi:hypothetical protein